VVGFLGHFVLVGNSGLVGLEAATPVPQLRYTLDELLVRCDGHCAIPQEDREWLEAPAVGDELL